MSKAVETVKSFYAALARGDVPAVLGLLANDLRWTEAEGFPYYSGTWTSPVEVLEKLLKPLMNDWNDFTATASEFIADGNRVVSLGFYGGHFKATGKTMRAPFAHVWTVGDGKLLTFDMYTDTLLIERATR